MAYEQLVLVKALDTSDGDFYKIERADEVDEDDFAVVSDGPFTAEQLAGFCDGRAENRNAHDYVNAHKVLTGLLNHYFGREMATNAMYEIAKRGGLDGMNGVRGYPDSFEEFGLKDDGDYYAWSLRKEDE